MKIVPKWSNHYVQRPTNAEPGAEQLEKISEETRKRIAIDALFLALDSDGFLDLSCFDSSSSDRRSRLSVNKTKRRENSIGEFFIARLATLREKKEEVTR